MTVAVEYHQMRVVNQSVNDCLCQDWITKNVVPLTELQVGGDNDALGLITH